MTAFFASHFDNDSDNHFDEDFVIAEPANAIFGAAAPRQRIAPTNVPHDAIQFCTET
jgi:hypothetical protein